MLILKVLHGRSGGFVGGRVGDYNDTGGPNWSAEAALMISWVGQLGPGVAIYILSITRGSNVCY